MTGVQTCALPICHEQPSRSTRPTRKPWDKSVPGKGGVRSETALCNVDLRPLERPTKKMPRLAHTNRSLKGRTDENEIEEPLATCLEIPADGFTSFSDIDVRSRSSAKEFLWDASYHAPEPPLKSSIAIAYAAFKGKSCDIAFPSSAYTRYNNRRNIFSRRSTGFLHGPHLVHNKSLVVVFARGLQSLHFRISHCVI